MAWGRLIIRNVCVLRTLRQKGRPGGMRAIGLPLEEERECPFGAEAWQRDCTVDLFWDPPHTQRGPWTLEGGGWMRGGGSKC